MQNKTIKIEIKVPIPEFFWLKDQYWKLCKAIHKIKMSSFWCKLTGDHAWKYYQLSEFTPHWRKCLRCDERELDHNDSFKGGNCDWKPTAYGTPEWNS